MNILIEIKKVLPAFLIAPAIPVCLVMTVAILGGGSGAGWLIIFSGIIAYGLVFTCGIPMYLILKKFDCVGLVSLLLSGLLLSLIPVYYFVISPRLDLINKGIVDSLFTYSVMLQISIFLVLSSIGVAIFWFILNKKT